MKNPNRATNDFLTRLKTVEETWIGFRQGANEGSWTWTDGTPVCFQNWNINEPNNGGSEVRRFGGSEGSGWELGWGGGGGAENFGTLWDNGAWNDLSQSDHRSGGYLCQK